MKYYIRGLKKMEKEEEKMEKQTDRVLKITPNMIFKTTMLNKRISKQNEKRTIQKNEEQRI